MENKYIYILVVIIIGLAAVLIISNERADMPEVDPIESPELNDEELPVIDDEEELTEERKELVSEYIEENISDLSPVEEVLGGTFYVVSMDFIGDDSILLEYEDGHISLMAEVIYSVENDTVTIEYFEVMN